jgi:hypothetical protein
VMMTMFDGDDDDDDDDEGLSLLRQPTTGIPSNRINN